MHRAFTLLAALLAMAVPSLADEPVVTVLADFEDNTVGIGIADVKNVLAADCTARFEANPARGQRSLAVTIGATVANSAATCELRFQFATPFAQADRIATQAWINQGDAEVAFRVRDGKGRIFETAAAELSSTRRWNRIATDLTAGNLKRVALPPGSGKSAKPGDADDGSPLAWPIEIIGYRVMTKAAARQVVYLDDLQVEHIAAPQQAIRGRFLLDQPTHMYAPGAQVAAHLEIENFSRKQQLTLSVQASWLRGDGSELTTAQASLNLPASGPDFRSHQTVDFSQRVDEPGLYRLVARARHGSWRTPAVFETTIAVTPSNRALSRGRATFFGVRTNLLREPLDDQTLEIDLAREVGVQLLAIDTPWRLIEPKQGTFDLAPLEPLVAAVAKRDMACMLVLTEPPEWNAADAGQIGRQSPVIEAMTRTFGTKVRFYQPVAGNGAGQLNAAELTALTQMQTKVAAIQSTATIVPPPLPIDDAKTRATAEAAAAPFPLGFETSGDPMSSLARLSEFAAASGWKWRASDWWWQHDRPRRDSGFLYDAVTVLKYYISAAQAGVGSAVWFDLRDDTVDPRYPEQMRGLARRDFSPKTVILGYANAVGMLGGLGYRGPVAGTPDEFDSAIFMSGERQVAVIIPRPNRILPRYLGPSATTPGELVAFDFERRQQAVDTAWSVGLVRSLPRPMFLRLSPENAQTEPKISLARPWLRVPSQVLVGAEGSFVVEMDTSTELGLRYAQLDIPAKSLLKSPFSPAEIKSAAGKPARFDIKLTRTKDGPVPPSVITLHVATGTQVVDVPIEIRPLFEVKPLADGAKLSVAESEIARLRVAGADDKAASMPLLAGYQEQKLSFGLMLPADLKAGSEVLLGLAAEDADDHVEVKVTNPVAEPKLEPVNGTPAVDVAGWTCSKAADKASGQVLLSVEIPAKAVAKGKIAGGQRLLIAARLVQGVDGRGNAPPPMLLGAGLDGDRSTLGYEWIQLAGPAKP